MHWCPLGQIFFISMLVIQIYIQTLGCGANVRIIALCVQKGFGTVRAKVRACGQFSSCDLRLHFFYVLSHFVP
jgi:hypothetical protein